MKAERKHELEKNDLDDALVKVVRFFRDNGVVLAIGAAVIVLGLLTYNLLISRRDPSAPAGAWNNFFYALSDDDADRALDKFVDDEKNATSPAVLWGKLSHAKLQIAKAAQQLFEDRKAAEETLAEAERNFKDVEKNASRNAELRDLARIGLGEVFESQNKPDEALKYYEMVLKSSPESASGKIAARSQKRLSSSENREFLTWFESHEPTKRSNTPAGHSIFGPKREVPEMPDFGLPGLPSGEASGGGEPPLEFPSRKFPMVTTPDEDPAANPDANPSETPAETSSQDNAPEVSPAKEPPPGTVTPENGTSEPPAAEPALPEAPDGEKTSD